MRRSALLEILSLSISPPQIGAGAPRRIPRPRPGYQGACSGSLQTQASSYAALSELDETPETAEREQEAAPSRGEALKSLEHDRDTLMESYAGTIRVSLDDLAPEERHRVYKLLRLNARARPDWPLEITGIFAEVAEEAEMGLSSCKLS